MSRELDVRDFSVDQSSQPRLDELESRATAVSQLLSGEHVVVVTDVDPTTGNAARIASTDSSAGEADFVQRALDHVQAVSPALGLTSRGREFVADPHALKTSAGGRAVNLQQTYQGIPIFQSAQTVRFEPDGHIGEIWCATLRDAIFLALDHALAANVITTDVHTQTKKTMWTVFAHFGMGPAARSNGAQLSGIVADHNPPAD